VVARSFRNLSFSSGVPSKRRKRGEGEEGGEEGGEDGGEEGGEEGGRGEEGG
jgi:hypothetical protein